MNSIDLKDLYNGLITVIILSISIGQYGKLRDFARKEFIQAMNPRVSNQMLKAVR